MIELVIVVLVMAITFVFIMLYRNELVFKCRMRALEEGGAKHAVSAGTYGHMMYDFRKWTYNQFYGDKL